MSFSIHVSTAGELHRPSGVAGGRAALVLHEAPGITGNVQRRCAALAALGYTAFAPDLHRAGRSLGAHESHAALLAYRESPDLLRNRVTESLELLCAEAGVPRERVVVLGYCFGGMAALELARSGAQVAAIASFHGLLTTRAPARHGQLPSPLLVCTGGQDTLVPASDVALFHEEMAVADAEWELIVYGRAGHSFTNADAALFGDARMRHDPHADRDSWERAMAFFNRALA